MPKLPQASDLNVTQQAPARSFVNMPQFDYTTPFNSVAQGLRDVASAATQIGDDRYKRQQAQERFDTRMGLLKGEADYNERTKDLDPLDPQYVQKKQQARRETFGPILSGVKDPENKQYFDASTYEDYVKIGINAGDEQKAAYGKKAEFDITNFTDAQVGKVSTGSDPQAVLNDTYQAIDDNQHIDSLTKEVYKKKAQVQIATIGLQTKALGEYGNLSGSAIVHAVIGAESSHNPGAVSPKGAQGLMQVMPSTAPEIAADLHDEEFFKMSPKQREAYLQREDVSIHYGTYYLNKQLKKYGGDLEAALIAYNAGPGNADKWLAAGRNYDVLPKKEETQPYVQKIFATLGVDATTAKQDPRLLATKDDVQTSIKSDPLFMSLPVDEQSKLLSGIDGKMKEAEVEQQKYIEQSLTDATISQSMVPDAVLGQAIDADAAYKKAATIKDPALRKSVTGQIDQQVRRQEGVRKGAVDAQADKTYGAVVDALKSGDPVAAQKAVDASRSVLPPETSMKMDDLIGKGLNTYDDEDTKHTIYGLYMQDQAGFLKATENLPQYWGKLTFATVADLKAKRDKILGDVGKEDKTNAGVNTVVKSASGKIDDRLREIGVDPNARAGKPDAKYANFIRTIAVEELEKFAADKGKAGETPLDSEVDAVVKSVFKSYPRAKAAGGWFGYGADTDVDILEVSKSYDSAGLDINAAAEALRKKGKPVNADTLQRTLDLVQSKKAK